MVWGINYFSILKVEIGNNFFLCTYTFSLYAWVAWGEGVPLSRDTVVMLKTVSLMLTRLLLL